jgi:hypothetical protein
MDMRDRIVGALALVTALAAGPAWAQMHKVAKPQQVVRAVGVYEWMGNLAKPTASRLIPVSLFINGEFQDAGVYMAQPVPFALETGNVYELKESGIAKGTLDVELSRHLQTVNGDYEDGWLGYGDYKAPAAAKPATLGKAVPASQMAKVESSMKDTEKDADRPTFADPDKRASASASSGNGPAVAANTGNPSAAPVGSAPANDPNRPVLKQPSTVGSNTGSASADSGAPANDPDRPVLKRRTPEEAKKAKEEAQYDTVGMVASLNDDPNRPKLHFGRPAGVTTGEDLPKLVGMPSNLHQMVAVSDAVDRDPHEFARPWADAAERAAILAKVETMARTKLSAYGAMTHRVAVEPTKRPTAASRSRRKTTTSAPPIALMDETLKGFTLSYGGDPTYVFTAHTAGTGAALRYVTVVAQTDEAGEVNPVIESVTDADHLDRTPEMRFVDVVDADASNRASLLFELREQRTRQFALYRVIAGQSQQIFLSGTTQ